MQERHPGDQLKISIVTPSYNQAQFLDACIKSVLTQRYENLEYVVIDGASTDGSVEILRNYNARFAFLSSEPDEGQYHAINKGFAHTSGEIMAWLNSDDMYTPWAFEVVAEIFLRFPEIEWLTTLYPLIWNRQGVAVQCDKRPGYSSAAFFKGENLSGDQLFSRGFIQQESTFWRRSLWERTGGKLDTSFRLAADFELWARFFKEAKLYAVSVPLGGFRLHGDQRGVRNREEYLREANNVLLRHGGKPFGTIPRLVGKLLPGRLRTFAGLVFQRPVCVYDQLTGQWKIREVVC